MESGWIYNNSILTSDLIEDNYGFVYLITNLENHRKYIGKKLFWKSKIRQIKKKKKKYKAESDWKTYFGSNKELLKDIEQYGKNNFKREVLKLCKTKGECSYYEAKYQFSLDVLTDPLYYNTWIMCRINKIHLSKNKEK